MALNREDIVHIAKLARLALSEDEIARFQTELSKILDYIGELQKVDTTEVEATAQVTGLTNRVANDVVVPVDDDTRQRLVDAFQSAKATT